MLITVHARAHPQAFSQILLCHVDVGQALKKKKKKEKKKKASKSIDERGSLCFICQNKRFSMVI